MIELTDIDDSSRGGEGREDDREIDDHTCFLFCSHPINGVDKYLLKFLFFRAFFDFEHVLPRREVRETHEDRLDARFGSEETELSSTIVDEIELYVSTSADVFPLHMILLVRRILSSVEDLVVCVEGSVSNFLSEEESLIPAAVEKEVVVENASDTSTLVTELNEEVFIAILFHLLEKSCRVRIANSLEGRVE